VTGSATLEPHFQARLQAKAERFRVLARVDRSITASGQAELVLGPDQGRLDGKVTIDEGFFDASQKDAPALDDDVTIRQAEVPEKAVADAAPPAHPWRLGLGVDIGLGDKLRFRGWGVDTGLRGDLRLTGFWGQPAIHGRIYSEDGTYAAYGQKLSIDRGVVEFLGPVGDPRLDILALRPNIDNQAGVMITGSALSPRVRLYSNPELSDSEKLSWLVLGRAPDGLGRSDTALLQRAAVALLAGEGEAPTDTLLRNLGIDELSLRQSEGDVRETVITLGKQLSRRWYLGYERGVNSTRHLAAHLPHRPALHAARTERAGQFTGRDLGLAHPGAATRCGHEKIHTHPAVVQWIERAPPKRQIQVRFLSEGPWQAFTTAPKDSDSYADQWLRSSFVSR
jgi:translocation and assembly module TamB